MYDVVLVGGGVSNLSVLTRLAQRRTLSPGACVAFVDPAGETGGGAAYARNVHPALLLNDRIQKIDRTGIGFGAWLAANAASVLDDLRRHEDDRVRRWLRWYGPQLAQGDVTELYLPRTVFGRFARERFDQARRALVEQDVTVDVFTARVDDVWQTAQGWQLQLPRVGTLLARAVVLGVGGAVAAPASTHPRYLLGRPGLDLVEVERAVARAAGGDVLLLGAAASAVEIVYCLEGNRRLRSAFGSVVAVSPSGRLPDGLGTENSAPFAVRALLGDGNTADALLRDLADDVRAARALGLRMPDAYAALHDAFARRFRRMSEAEKKRVTDVYVPTYLSLVRKTSTVYSAGAERLRARGQLGHVTGRVQTVLASDEGVTVTLQDGRVLRGAVALDCRGFGTAEGDALMSRLIAAGTVGRNDSNMGGVRVNARFEAAPGLLVLGPLLAGTPRAGDHIWHLEDIPRIHALADEVVATLDQVLSVGAPVEADAVAV
jgi:uncharacterized NAD(P)/FAD-binding protein YdhS